MAKKGGTYHTKRLAIPKAIPIGEKKTKRFLLTTAPGPHQRLQSIPLAVLLRDILHVSKTASESRKILSAKEVLVDGKVRMDGKFPVGMMDSITFPKTGESYRIIVNRKGQLVPVQTKSASLKIGKVVHKHTVRGGKTNITLHDGRNILVDNNVRVGDSVLISVPAQKVEKLLKFEQGAKCLITKGKHAGTIATLEEILVGKEGGRHEARMKGTPDFVTIAKYLFVVDDSYEGAEKGA